MSEQTVMMAGQFAPEGESSKPLRRPDYVLRMAIDANIAVTMERVSTGCWVGIAFMAAIAPGLWTGIACGLSGVTSVVLMLLSERRMRRVNDATGVKRCS